MDVKKKVREALLKEDKKHEYGCLMVGLDIDKDIWNEIQNIIDSDDLYIDPKDPSFGREMNPHVTILFGLHETIKDEEIEKDIKEIKKPKLTNNGVSFFTAKDYDVLKFDIVSSQLESENKKFKEYPYTNNFKDYKAHATIAYLKPNTIKKYLEKLEEFEDYEFVAKELIYSKANKTKKTYQFKDK